MSGSITEEGVDLFAERFLGTSSEGAISKFGVGLGTTDATVNDTALETPVPITDGTVLDDGNNQLTGSSGGDNTTDNTTIFKPGAGVSDNTAQNLIANDTNASKVWTISDLSSNGSYASGAEVVGLWVYVKDTTALSKFKTSGTCLEVKLGSDSSNYYSLTKTASDLSTGWNWISSNTANLNALTETGTVSGDIDTFIIEITTNNTTDTFVVGDVIYDLLRQWTNSNVFKTLEPTFPSYEDVANKISSLAVLELTEANGFDITELVLTNSDETVYSRYTFTAYSKSNTEKLKIDVKDLISN